MRSLPPVLLAGLLLLAAERAQACSCAEEAPPAEALASAAAVFQAEVTDIDDGGAFGCGSSMELEVELDVSRVWKGDVGSRVTVTTNTGGGSCGYSFEVGTTYLVYAHEYEGELRTSICSRTRPIDQASEDLEVLGPGEQARLDVRATTRHAGLGGYELLVLLAALGLRALPRSRAG